MTKFYSILIRCWLLISLMLASSAGFAQNLWRVVQGRNASSAPRAILPTKFALYTLNETDFLTATQNLYGTVGELELPMPDGTLQTFRLTETPLLEPAFAAKLPEVKTFTAHSNTDPTAIALLDWTMNGFHGMILSERGTVFIDPYTADRSTYYMAYYKADYPKTARNTMKSCHTIEDDYWKQYSQEREKRFMGRNVQIKPLQRPSGSVKRTYRAVVAATGEYTQARGGTVASAQASIITTMNRVRGVYEKELAVSFTLVDNTDIVFANGATDPFSNDDPGNLIDESQTQIDSKIGNANYDVGHTFSTGGGGLAGLGVVCRTGEKASGITGSDSPFNDPYDIDYVAHELGHQFGCEHTFNGNIGSCGGGNRSSSSAYEPGSGSTIMAYAGICGSHDIQNNSDPYFHTRSYDQALDYTTIGSGNSCPVKTNMTNAIPVLTMPTGGFSIPKGTPFALTASATDANASDVLTYCWEEYDLGPGGVPNNSSASGPAFRSFTPTTSPTRYFPRTAGNPALAPAIGETLPATGRSYKFRCTVRDKKTETSNDPKTLDIVGGVEYSEVSFSVTGSAGPFLLTYPSATGISLAGGSNQTITWDVNSTDVAPVNCTTVDILLSTDGGVTYSTTLLSGTPNDGNQQVTLPNISTTTARIKIKPSNNIFFDYSDNNFAITFSSASFDLTATPPTQVLAPSVVYNINVSAVGGFTGVVDLSVAGNPAGTTATLGTTSINTNGTTTLTIGNTDGVVGQFDIVITGKSGSITKTATVRLDAGGKGNGVVSIYPVPADQYLTVQVSIPDAMRLPITITDETGRPVRSFEVTKGTGTLVYNTKTSDLPNGVYIIQVKVGETTYTRKFVKLSK